MRYFKFKELIRSSKADEKGIDNFPKDAEIIDNLILVMENLDKIREEYGLPIYISSGYRCDELNKAVGGVSNSQHKTGNAVDVNLGSIEKNRAFFNWVVCNRENIEFDQLIDESHFSWVHISFKKEGGRKQVLHLG